MKYSISGEFPSIANVLTDTCMALSVKHEFDTVCQLLYCYYIAAALSTKEKKISDTVLASPNCKIQFDIGKNEQLTSEN